MLDIDTVILGFEMARGSIGSDSLYYFKIIIYLCIGLGSLRSLKYFERLEVLLLRRLIIKLLRRQVHESHLALELLLLSNVRCRFGSHSLLVLLEGICIYRSTFKGQLVHWVLGSFFDQQLGLTPILKLTSILT